MKTLCKNIIYLLGDSAEKRRVLRSAQNVARAHNDEVTDVCRIRGRDYYVVGTHPFADFTVLQYVRYERALIDAPRLSDEAIRQILRACGTKARLHARMGKLSFVDRRLVTLAARVTLQTVTVAINLDGVPFSRALRTRLHRAAAKLSRKYEVWISVTDSRFINKNSDVAEMRQGKLPTPKKTDCRSRTLARRILLARMRRCFAQPEHLEKGKIVMVNAPLYIAHR